MLLYPSFQPLVVEILDSRNHFKTDYRNR